MFYLLNDANFYVALSFMFLVGVAVIKYKGVILRILDNRIQAIREAINHASAEKEKALLELTRANQAMSKLPDDVAKIWERYSIDFQKLHNNLDLELNKQERLNKIRLDYIQEQLLKHEYVNQIDEICEKFKMDIQISSPEERHDLLLQSIDLLDNVKLPF